MLTEEQLKTRADLASKAAKAKRNGRDPKADPDVVAATQQYRYVSATEYVRKLVDSAPPLTPEQRERLAALLRGGGHLAS